MALEDDIRKKFEDVLAQSPLILESQVNGAQTGNTPDMLLQLVTDILLPMQEVQRAAILELARAIDAR